MAGIELSDPNVQRLMWRLGLPAMAGLSLNAAHQAVDAAFVGRLGAEPLAALLLLAPMAGLVAAAGIGLGIGAASSVARSLGANNADEARAVTGLALLVAAALAICAVAGLLLFADPVLRLLGAQGAVLDVARPYLTVQAITIGCAILQIQCDFLAIGRGNAQFSLKTLALCFGLNILLDPLFIFGFDLGLPGAAWATLCAQIITLAVWVWHFTNRARRPKIGTARLLGPVLRVGMPEAASVAITTLSLMALLRLATEFDGAGSVAALGIALRLIFVVMLPLEGFAIGVQPILSYAFGRHDAERFAMTLRLILWKSFGVTTTLAILFFLLAQPLVSVFVTDPGILENATLLLRCLAIALPAIALRLCVQISLQATIRPRAAAVLGLAPMGWLLWPLVALLVPGFGVLGIALAVLIAAWIAAMLALITLRTTPNSLQSTGVSV
jgi:putative MATE family efflux protein